MGLVEAASIPRKRQWDLFEDRTRNGAIFTFNHHYTTNYPVMSSTFFNKL